MTRFTVAILLLSLTWASGEEPAPVQSASFGNDPYPTLKERRDAKEIFSANRAVLCLTVSPYG